MPPVDGTRLASGSSDQMVRVWDTGVDAVMMQLLYQINTFQPVRTVALSPDGSQVICATDHGAVQLWNTRSSYTSSHEVNSGWTGLRLDDEGWLRGPNNELKLWLNQEHREILTHPECVAVLYGGRSSIEWVPQAEGSSWTQCYTGIQGPRPSAATAGDITDYVVQRKRQMRHARTSPTSSSTVETLTSHVWNGL